MKATSAEADRQRRGYTPDEITTLKTLLKLGKEPNEIASVMGRSPEGIRVMASRIRRREEEKDLAGPGPVACVTEPPLRSSVPAVAPVTGQIKLFASSTSRGIPDTLHEHLRTLIKLHQKEIVVIEQILEGIA